MFTPDNSIMSEVNPIPVNDPSTFMGFAVHMQWNLHHYIALAQSVVVLKLPLNFCSVGWVDRNYFD